MKKPALILFHCSDEMKTAIKDRAVRDDTSSADIIRQAVTLFLQKKKNNEKRKTPHP